jgi:hypothetical protein
VELLVGQEAGIRGQAEWAQRLDRLVAVAVLGALVVSRLWLAL